MVWLPMAEPIPAEVTQLLQQWSSGDRDALDDLIPLVYEELRRMAQGHMARERDGHTMQATALVNEVYLKLKNERASSWHNRAQFFAVAAQMMRRILVDYARQQPAPNAAVGAASTLDDAMLVSKITPAKCSPSTKREKLEQFDHARARWR